jgi:ketosteroid isomerase-like protein
MTTGTTPSATPLRDALQATLDEMARVYSAQDAAACAALFTSDASIFSPFAPPTYGCAGIEALHRIWAEKPSAKRFQILEFGGDRNLAWALAQFSEGAATAEGTTLVVFERQQDSRWLIRICSLNEGRA